MENDWGTAYGKSESLGLRFAKLLLLKSTDIAVRENIIWGNESGLRSDYEVLKVGELVQFWTAVEAIVCLENHHLGSWLILMSLLDMTEPVMSSMSKWMLARRVIKQDFGLAKSVKSGHNFDIQMKIIE